MKDFRELRKFYERHQGEKMVLCTIVRKVGSSYRDVFAKKILSLETTDGFGLLSGGCLEKEIEETARTKAPELPFIKSFSTLSDEDRFLGYQKGCTGLIDILFEALPTELDKIDLYLPFGESQAHRGVGIDLHPQRLGARFFVASEDEFVPTRDQVFEPWTTPIKLTVIGCGADADPFIELTQTLGWDLRLVDYRSDLAHPGRFSNYGGVVAECCAIDRIAASVAAGNRHAIVLLTHNFEADLHLYAGLMNKKIGYLACVGPRKRYDQLKKDLKALFGKEPDPLWDEQVVKAPAGITPSDTNPADIAFSIVAEIQVAFRGREKVPGRVSFPGASSAPAREAEKPLGSATD